MNPRPNSNEETVLTIRPALGDQKLGVSLVKSALKVYQKLDGAERPISGCPGDWIRLVELLEAALPQEVDGGFVVDHEDRERPVLVEDVGAGRIPRALWQETVRCFLCNSFNQDPIL